MKYSNIKISADTRDVVSIDNFSYEENKVTLLFGESGIGKSIITKGIYGLLDPGRLRVSVNSIPYPQYLRLPHVKMIRDNGFFVFQEPSSHLNSLMKISEQLAEGSLKKASNQTEILKSLWRDSSDSAISKILDLYPKPYRPSGGEKQRVLLAMAFKKLTLYQQNCGQDDPHLFVFDEPTGSLDNVYRNLFLEMLFDLFRQKPFTVLLITHDYSIISEIFQNHDDISGKIRFKELSRLSGTKVTLNNFSPDDYLKWLRDMDISVKEKVSQKPVLNFNSKCKVFGRSLAIYRDKAKNQLSDLVVRQGETIYLKAPSGMGKTTIAKIIMGLYQADKFSMILSGLQINEKTPEKFWMKKIWGKTAGMVFQHADESLNMEASVKETFTGLPSHPNTAELKAALSGLFEEDTAREFLNKKVAFLSGGQKQRLNLLRTLMLGLDLIIFDEPLNGLDFKSIKKVLSLLEQKRADGCSFLIISHNEEIFDHYVDDKRIYYLGEV